MADPLHQETSPPQGPVGALLTGSLAVDAVFLPAERLGRDLLLGQREDRAECGPTGVSAHLVSHCRSGAQLH
jgi:hypothetical protein